MNETHQDSPAIAADYFKAALQMPTGPSAPKPKASANQESSNRLPSLSLLTFLIIEI